MWENIEHQYRIIENGAGLIDRRRRGVIRVDGPDRLTFLHALVTNDLLTVPPNSGVTAAYLTPQGRMAAIVDILNRGDHVLLLVPEDMAASLGVRLDALIFAEQVSVVDASADWGEICVTGGSAASVVARAFGADEEELSRLAELEQTGITRGFIVRRGESPLPMFSVFLPNADREPAILRLESLGVVPMLPELEVAMRIEAGRGAWGTDLSEDTIPLEAGLLERAISTTKGCYVGQEVIIRILHRGGGRVAKRLVQLALAPGTHEPPAPGASLAQDAEVVGRITSTAFSPARGTIVALGYVRRDVAEVGKTVAAGSDGRAAEIIGFAR